MPQPPPPLRLPPSQDPYALASAPPISPNVSISSELLQNTTASTSSATAASLASSTTSRATTTTIPSSSSALRLQHQHQPHWQTLTSHAPPPAHSQYQSYKFRTVSTPNPGHAQPIATSVPYSFGSTSSSSSSTHFYPPTSAPPTPRSYPPSQCSSPYPTSYATPYISHSQTASIQNPTSFLPPAPSYPHYGMHATYRPRVSCCACDTASYSSFQLHTFAAPVYEPNLCESRHSAAHRPPPGYPSGDGSNYWYRYQEGPCTAADKASRAYKEHSRAFKWFKPRRQR